MRQLLDVYRTAELREEALARHPPFAFADAASFRIGAPLRSAEVTTFFRILDIHNEKALSWRSRHLCESAAACICRRPREVFRVRYEEQAEPAAQHRRGEELGSWIISYLSLNSDHRFLAFLVKRWAGPRPD